MLDFRFFFDFFIILHICLYVDNTYALVEEGKLSGLLKICEAQNFLFCSIALLVRYDLLVDIKNKQRIDRF